ncbi:MAG TPA: DNA-processing protein DprA [Gemmatimonadaceae bacterium]|nr:DNA-processing protein DprA [Gemmatimonadaceae bacterium]
MNELPRGSSYPENIGPAERIPRHDDRYPRDLDDLQENAPTCLWTRGAVGAFNVRPRVAIVGTRRATAYGQRITRELTAAFVRAGACIVSGLATGIDGTAHRTALEDGGTTIAVLGTGLDVFFPSGHKPLQLAIAERGLLVTELEADEHGMRFTFPRRNRIIAALAMLTIVVEAPEKSGALNTAEHAMELGRDVAAVPGPIDQPQSAGTNRLIASGAHIIASVADALALAGLTPPPRTPSVAPEGDEGRVWSALADGGLDIDALCHRSGLPAARCLSAVTRLEIAGSIECALTGEIRRR